MSTHQVRIILTKDVESLGLRHQIKIVAAGFARNYLFPQRLAIPGTPGMIAQFEKKQSKLATAEETTTAKAIETKKKLEAAPIHMTAAAAKDGMLYGSVSAQDIVEKIKKETETIVEKRFIFIPSTIKKAGEYTITLKLFRSVKARIKLIVDPEISTESSIYQKSS